MTTRRQKWAMFLFAMALPLTPMVMVDQADAAPIVDGSYRTRCQYLRSQSDGSRLYARWLAGQGCS